MPLHYCSYKFRKTSNTEIITFISEPSSFWFLKPFWLSMKWNSLTALRGKLRHSWARWFAHHPGGLWFGSEQSRDLRQTLSDSTVLLGTVAHLGIFHIFFLASFPLKKGVKQDGFHEMCIKKAAVTKLWIGLINQMYPRWGVCVPCVWFGVVCF